MNHHTALKIALDALENTASRRASEQFVIEQHAIAFIKKALDRVAPAPVAKNEGGRITWLVDDWPQNCFLYSEPPSWTPVEIGVDVTPEGAHVVGMYVLPDAVRYVFYSKFHTAPPQREEGCAECGKKSSDGWALYCVKCIEAVQEPIGWVYEDDEGRMMFSQMPHPDPLWEPVYRAAPNRKWVGLADEEIKEILGPWGAEPIKGYTRELIDKIEAKLKEKNI